MSAEASQLATQAAELEDVGLLDQIVEKSKVAKSQTEHDRAKDIIISGGENISTIEVEQALASHPEVLDLAVVGVADEKWGERPVAYVIRSSGSSLDAKELISFAREKLAGYKVPRTIIFPQDLPRTSTGKVQKNVLRAQAIEQQPSA